MGKLIDLTGKKFGKLTVVEFSHKGNHRNSYWKCKCECGNETIVDGVKLRSGHTQSCGCLRHKKQELPSCFDLTGKKFGKLTVLSYAYSNRGTYWNCLCDCGNEKIVSGTSLLSNRVKSCGCLSKEVNHKKLQDLTGKRFGRLVVESYNIDIGKWHCICDCGNTCDVVSGSLRKGLTQSCGCLHKEVTHNIKFKDLTGQKFHMLTVKSLNRIDGRTYWNCICECGNETVVDASKLGYTQSCGCIDVSHRGSKAENEIRDYIQSNFPDLKLEFHNRQVLDGKEIDIYIPEIKVGIEYNGSAYHATENGLYDNVDKYYHRDKFLLARSKGIHLITVFDIDYAEHKDKVLDIIYNTLSGSIYSKIPTYNVIYTDNDYEIGTWLTDYGYVEVGQVEPDSFIYDKGYVVYRCGKTKWLLKT